MMTTSTLRTSVRALCTAAGSVSTRTVSVVGAPMRFGQPIPGTDEAPAALRRHGLLDNLGKLGWAVKDLGDADMPRPQRTDPRSDFGGENTFAVGVGNARIHAMTKEAAEDGDFVLTVGGDHSVALGSISGVLSARPDLGVIWVDAHADINDPRTSPSGNIHGMPLSFLTRLVDPAAVAGFEWLSHTPVLDTNKLVYIGLRDLDQGEIDIINDLHIKTFTMQHIDRWGIGKVMDLALDHLYGAGCGNIHMSYDIDAVDPSVAPSTGTTVKGGLNYREAHYVAEAASASGLLSSMDIVEVNPKLVSDMAAIATISEALGIVSSAFGKSILGSLHQTDAVDRPALKFPLPPKAA